MINFNDIPTNVLVDTYNGLADALGHKPVTKFADRKTAEDRTRKVLSMVAPEKRPAPFTEAASAPASGPTKAEKDVAKEAAKVEKDRLKAEAAAAKAAAKDQTPTPPVGPSLPIASDDKEKDSQMPVLRKVVRLTDLKAKTRVFPRKEGTAQAALVDLLARPQGATFAEMYDTLKAARNGKPWTGVSIRSMIAWDINHLTGYGVTSEALNGEEFAKQGRTYEANRLGFGTTAYNPDFKLLVYRLALPKGMEVPLAHTPRPTKPSKEQIAAAKAATAEALKAAKEAAAKQ
jgi:hypothetical protein